MKVSFICCEYNPFHNGHKYHLDETKKNDTDAVVCIMSGNFVQRGDIAVCEKHMRAKAAILNGADLVLELPLKYAVSTAGIFADGFIKTAGYSGLEGLISFGAADDINDLQLLSHTVFSQEAEDYTKKALQSGTNYPTAKAEYIKNKLGDRYKIMLCDPNNILAIEYIRAAREYFPECDFFAVNRKNVSHNSNVCKDGFASASFIRQYLYEAEMNDEFTASLYNIRELVPQTSFDVLLEAYSCGLFPSSKEIFNTVSMARLIDINESDLLKINNVREGIENRIIAAIKKNNSIEDIFEAVKTKRFTHSRIRQIITAAVLGITKDDISSADSYIRTLAFNNKGREVLREIKLKSQIPFIMNLSEIADDVTTQRQFHIDNTSGKIFSLCNKFGKGNIEFDIPPVYINK